MRNSHVLAVASLIAALPALLPAQASPSSDAGRSGFYGTLGMSYGAQLFSASGGSNVSSGAPAPGNSAVAATNLSIGYMFAGRWRLSADVDYLPSFWLSGHSSACCGTQSVYYMAAAAFYDIGIPGLWVKASLGYATYHSVTPYFTPGGCSCSSTVVNNSVAGGLGLGFDLHVAHGPLIVAPFINYEAQFKSSVIDPVSGATGRSSLLAAGLGFGYSR